MIRQHRRACLVACLASGLVPLASLPALAGSFGLHEHSASAQGESYAGVAAGGQLSSMFWNPAIMTQFTGVSLEASASVFVGRAKDTVTATGFETPDLLKDAIVPAMYASWQVQPDLWLGVSVNAPFGLSVGFPDNWAGRFYAGDTSLKTYNATPSLAYRINDWLSIGVGLQIEYATASLENGLPPGPGSDLLLKGNGWGFGATAGITVTPGPNTIIGLGWRSGINQKIDGSVSLPAGFPASTPGDAKTTLKLPDIVSLGIRQRVSPQVTLLGTVEWTNWSRIGTSTVLQGNGAPVLVGGGQFTLPFQYRDGWLFSAGAEYAWRPDTILKAGVGYEISPITTAVRTPRIPDSNRIWLSAGLTQALSPNLKLDFAYSHLFVAKADVAIEPGNPWFNPAFGTYFGTASGSIDIISVGVKYQFGPPALPPPLIRKG